MHIVQSTNPIEIATIGSPDAAAHKHTTTHTIMDATEMNWSTQNNAPTHTHSLLKTQTKKYRALQHNVLQ